MRYKYILFDFDGTLVDSVDAVVATMNDTLAFHNLGHNVVTNGSLTSKHVYKEFADKIDPQILRTTHRQLQINHYHRNTLFPQVKLVLKQLIDAGCVLAILTTANEPKVTYLMKRLRLSTLFHCVVTEADSKNLKPHPEHFEEVYRKLGLTETDKKFTLMVGDTKGDVEGARNFGIDVAAVTFGSYEKSIWEYNPTYTINSLIELLPIVGVSYEQ